MIQLKKLFLVTIVVMLLPAANTAAAAGVGKNIAVRIIGTATGYDGDALYDEYGAAYTGDTLCWDFDMRDVKTGNSIGYVSDCAEIVDIVLTDIGLGYAVIGTTFFYFPGGTVVSQVDTTVMPLTHGFNGFTHVTGAVPAGGTDNVVYGDRKFKSAVGTVRFSGVGDFTTTFDDGVLTADCLFTLDISTGSN